LVALFEGPVAGRWPAPRYSPLFWWPRPRLGHTAGSALGSASGFRLSSERPSMRHLFIMFRPRFITAHPTSVITDHRRYTGVTITGYVIIVIAAAAIDPSREGNGWSESGEPHRPRKAAVGTKAVAAPALFGVSPPFSDSGSAAIPYGNHPASCRAGFPVCRQAGSTSTRNGCSSILAINKTSHCFCSATSNV
jgi:hypothetical protein